jgi:5-methylthioadenosine/S-adenosylhomocysteine deaminase
VDRGELYDLHKAGAGIAHCPTSNLKLASGIAQLGQMMAMGLKVGVGTDGPASNNDLDMFEEMRLAAFLAKTTTNDPTTLPARQALALATIGGARALHLDRLTGSLKAGKRADLAVVTLSEIHNWPHFTNNTEAIYSRLVYATKASDVTDVMCNGRWLMRDRQLLTVDQEKVMAEAAEVAARIDAFVLQRESSPYNKLVLLAGVQRQESYEVQVKVPVSDDGPIVAALEGDEIEIVRQATFNQYDSYFRFDGRDPDAARLRYREDEFLDDQGEIYQARSRLTLLGQAQEQEFPNAVMLSRSRYIAPATQSLRFYREYFDPLAEVEVHKKRRRWRILYRDTDFAINLDRVTRPRLPGFFLEIKSRTWSRQDAMRKAALISELLALLGLDPSAAERKEYPDLVTELEGS